MPGPLVELRARYVLPMDAPPIEGGCVAIQGERFVSVAAKPATANPIDLGDVAVLPGLVNTHTHLDLNDVPAPLGRPGMRLVDWIGEVIRHRLATPSTARAVLDGLCESARLGTTSLADISQAIPPFNATISDHIRKQGATGILPVPSSGNLGATGVLPVPFGDPRTASVASTGETPVAPPTTPRVAPQVAQPVAPRVAPPVASSVTPEMPCVRLVSFLELIAPTLERVELQVERARSHIAAGREAASWLPGLSPHAPYSIQLDLLIQAVALSAENHVPLAMHLAESPEELELVEHRCGPFRDFLERLGAWNSEAFPDGLTILGYLQMLAGAHRALVIHGNYLSDEEMIFLADRADRMAVVYCPRTHAFFDHDPYPLEKMLAAGVVVALGTDSRASSPDLSLLAEMREAARQHPSINPETILRLGTLGGATALGMSHQQGTITPGREADLAVVSLPDGGCRNAADLYHGLLESNASVVATWLRGKPFQENSFSEKSNP
ncbi:MAG: amidohydrolase family protein [Pirellulaceae bacterium]|nr:amidohydrolase family protein [Pirellulaceae bacterium]